MSRGVTSSEAYSVSLRQNAVDSCHLRFLYSSLAVGQCPVLGSSFQKLRSGSGRSSHRTRGLLFKTGIDLSFSKTFARYEYFHPHQTTITIMIIGTRANKRTNEEAKFRRLIDGDNSGVNRRHLASNESGRIFFFKKNSLHWMS